MSLGKFTVLHDLAVCFLVTHEAQAQSASTLDFKGRLLISVSDADMVASAYSDGDLGPVDGEDALSVIPLGKPPVTCVHSRLASAPRWSGRLQSWR